MTTTGDAPKGASTTPPMKWRECKVRESWYTGPAEGDRYWTARRAGITYRVQAVWLDPIARRGPVAWCGQAFPKGGGNTTRYWKTRESAMAWCETGAPPKANPAPV